MFWFEISKWLREHRERTSKSTKHDVFVGDYTGFPFGFAGTWLYIVSTRLIEKDTRSTNSDNALAWSHRPSNTEKYNFFFSCDFFSQIFTPTVAWSLRKSSRNRNFTSEIKVDGFLLFCSICGSTLTTFWIEASTKRYQAQHPLCLCLNCSALSLAIALCDYQFSWLFNHLMSGHMMTCQTWGVFESRHGRWPRHNKCIRIGRNEHYSNTKL